MMEMPLTRVEAQNFTVFEDITIPLGRGLNVLVGENGMGKTHIMNWPMQHVRHQSMMFHFHRRPPCFSGQISPVSDGW